MKISHYIDHTCLKPTTTLKDIKNLCQEAITHKFKAVCIPSHFLKEAKDILKQSDVKLCTVIGFPLGFNSTATKVFEAQWALKNGADEIDMVINIGALKEGSFDFLLEEIKEIKIAVGKNTLKVIIETALLEDKEIIKATQIVVQSGADFIKTSTGFSTRGASLNDIKLMKEHSLGKIGIKASGGIKNLQDAKSMIEAGATRLGTSSGVHLIQGQENNNNINY